MPARNLGALSASHALGVVLPLLTIPYLARTLGPDGWAPVLLAQSLASWGTMLLEYAFDLSAVRTLATARTASDCDAERARAVWGVVGAKVLLTPFILLGLWAVAQRLPSVRHDPSLVVATLSVALVRGMSPLWYFQGEERVTGALTVDAAARIAAALGVFITVHDGSDAWRVVGLQALTGGIALVWLMAWVRREVPVTRTWLVSAVESLRRGAALFFVRLIGACYAQIGTLWLGIAASTGAVTAYGGAERLMRAGVGLLDPVTRAFGARIALLRADDPRAATRLLRRLATLLGLGGGLAAAVVIWQADELVTLFLGEAYAGAVPTLRVMALLLPLTALGTVWGPLQTMSDGRDRIVLAAVSAGAVVGTGSMLLLVPRLQAVGMAAAVVVAEATVVAVLIAARRCLRFSRAAV